jgi:hypothetical protein
LGFQLAKGGVAVLGHLVLLLIEQGDDVALAVVEGVVVGPVLPNVEQTADAAAQVLALGVFADDRVAGIAVLQGQVAIADDAGLVDQVVVDIVLDAGQEGVVGIGEDSAVDYAIGIALADFVQAVLGIVAAAQDVGSHKMWGQVLKNKIFILLQSRTELRMAECVEGESNEVESTAHNEKELSSVVQSKKSDNSKPDPTSSGAMDAFFKDQQPDLEWIRSAT